MKQDAELQEAALRIQRIQRGRQSRKHARQAAEAKREHQENLELERAALRIQSIQRGRLARAQQKNRTPKSRQVIIDEDIELQKAALRIQSIRGRIQRKVFLEEKENSSYERKWSWKRQHQDSSNPEGRNLRKKMKESDILVLEDRELESSTKFKPSNGRATRKNMMSRSGVTRTEPLFEENLAEQIELERAALRIQSIQRGRAARRKRQAELREEEELSRAALRMRVQRGRASRQLLGDPRPLKQENESERAAIKGSSHARAKRRPSQLGTVFDDEEYNDEASHEDSVLENISCGWHGRRGSNNSPSSSTRRLRKTVKVHDAARPSVTSS